MTNEQIGIVENYRIRANIVELKSEPYFTANDLTQLLNIIDQLRAEPTLLKKLLRARYAFGKVDEYSGKYETYYYADDDEWFVRRAGIGGSQNDKVFPDFASLSQHLSQLLEKEV